MLGFAISDLTEIGWSAMGEELVICPEQAGRGVLPLLRRKNYNPLGEDSFPFDVCGVASIFAEAAANAGVWVDKRCLKATHLHASPNSVQLRFGERSCPSLRKFHEGIRPWRLDP